MTRDQAIKRELVRTVQFALVSLASATSNLLYIATLTRLTLLPFWVISLTSTEFSMVVNFILNDRFTFRNLDSNRPWYERLGRFQVAALGGNLLTVGIATMLHSGAAFSPLIAQTIAIVLTFIFNFLTHRFWTFREKAHITPRPRGVPSGETGGSPYWSGKGLTGLSVIIPARNERTTIRELLLRLDDAMTQAGLPYEALVIDDYSSDDTAANAAGIIAERSLPARVLRKQGKQGKSYALMEGFAGARYPVLAMIDADLELPPESLPGMARELERYEIVVGRRLNYTRDNFLRGQLSVVFNKLVMQLFLGINIEAQTGVKVFWKRTYESIEIAPGQWSFDMEFIAKALAKGFRVGEYEIAFQKRQGGVTNVNLVSVTLDLLLSAARVKFDIMRTVKANAALKAPEELASNSVPLTTRLKCSALGALEWPAPLALLFLFLRAMMGSAFFSSSRYFGVPGDTNQYMWFIGWVWWAILHGQDPMITSAFNYPMPIALMDYTSVPALGLLFGWLYPVAGMIFTFNLIIVINYTLIFVFGKLTLRALGMGRLLSGIGGLFFCLLPYITAQGVGHLNLAVISPLFAIGYLVVRVIHAQRRPSWLDGILLGLALTVAFYTYLETFLTLALCLLVVYACGLLCSRPATYRLTLRLARPRFLLGILAPLLLIIPGLLNFLGGQTAQPLDMSSLAVAYSADLLSLVVPTQSYLIHTSATTALTTHFTGNQSEWDSYLSLPLIALVVVLARRFWSDTRIRILAHAVTAMLILSLGPFLHIDGSSWIYPPLPWIAVLAFHAPFLQNVLPTRLGHYTEYLAIMLVMLGIHEYMKQPAAKLRPAGYRFRLGLAFVTLALVALCWMPLIPSYTEPMPQAARILGVDGASRYLQHQPTLVLNNEIEGFSNVMGILAESHDYTLTTSNVYGYSMANSTSFKINIAFVADNDGHQTAAALRQYLPEIGVGRVMFVSIDDQPLDPQRLTEISSYLGAPLYDNHGLVVIWRARSFSGATDQRGGPEEKGSKA